MEPAQKNLDSFAISVADHVSAMLAYWDANLVCRFANSAYMDWFGKTQDEMVNKMTMPELLGPLFEKNLPYIQGVLNGKPQTFEREIPVPGGSIRHSIANYFPDVQEGEVKGFFVHVADITPIKLLKNKLIQSNEIINEQNKRLLNFANIVSHNLKSYAGNLEAITGMLINARSVEEQKQMILYLQKLSKGFGKTLHQLNDIVKSHNLSKLNPEKINLHDYVETCIDVLWTQIKNTNALVLNKVNQDITLHVNAAYMESILLNFLTNAIKYRQPGRDPVIEVDALTKNEEIIITIKDNGRGMNLKNNAAKLFGLYQTFHNNPDAEGVGLFITKSQVESMGGRIEVASEEGNGTTFGIYFKAI